MLRLQKIPTSELKHVRHLRQQQQQLNTSYELLLSNIQLKFKTTNEMKHMRKMYNLEKLRSEDIKSELTIRIGGRFEPLLETEEDVDNLWRKGREIIRGGGRNNSGKEKKNSTTVDNR